MGSYVLRGSLVSEIQELIVLRKRAENTSELFTMTRCLLFHCNRSGDAFSHKPVGQ